jgi:hypothetical protein
MIGGSNTGGLIAIMLELLGIVKDFGRSAQRS